MSQIIDKQSLDVSDCEEIIELRNSCSVLILLSITQLPLCIFVIHLV